MAAAKPVGHARWGLPQWGRVPLVPKGPCAHTRRNLPSRASRARSRATSRPQKGSGAPHSSSRTLPRTQDRREESVLRRPRHSCRVGGWGGDGRSRASTVCGSVTPPHPPGSVTLCAGGTPGSEWPSLLSSTAMHFSLVFPSFPLAGASPEPLPAGVQKKRGKKKLCSVC